jgi:hypothetical protein
MYKKYEYKFSNIQALQRFNRRKSRRYNSSKSSEHQKMLMNLHPATHNFIQGMVDIQNQTVAEYSDLLNALYLVNVNNKLDLLYFEQTYF